MNEATNSNRTELADFLEQNLQGVDWEVKASLSEVEEGLRTWFKDQVSKDQRAETGRFLFTVSFTTIAILLALQRMEEQVAFGDMIFLVIAVGVLVASSFFALYLAVPRARYIDPDGENIVSLQRQIGKQIKLFSLWWFLLWLLGFVVGGIGIIAT